MVPNEYMFLNDGAGAAFALVAFDWKGTPESCYGKSFRSVATQGVWGIRSPMKLRFAPEERGIARNSRKKVLWIKGPNDV